MESGSRHGWMALKKKAAPSIAGAAKISCLNVRNIADLNLLVEQIGNGRTKPCDRSAFFHTPGGVEARKMSDDDAVVSGLLQTMNVRDEDLAIVHQLDDALGFQPRDLAADRLNGEAETVGNLGAR
jgi:hypothetical protein